MAAGERGRTVKALVIKANETQELIDIDDTGHGIRALQEAVGGYIEAVFAVDGWLLYANEDGRALNLPFNPKASALIASMCEITGTPMPLGADHLVGNAVIVGFDGGANSVEIPEVWVDRFKELDLWV